MDAPIISALQSILPSLSIIPAELVAQANAIFAQSQLSVKLLPRREFSRAYLSAHLAAERMQMSLSLPPPTPHHLPLPEPEYKTQFAQFQEKIVSGKKVQVTPIDVTPETINTICLILGASQEFNTAVWKGLSLILTSYDEEVHEQKVREREPKEGRDSRDVKSKQTQPKKALTKTEVNARTSLEWSLVGALIFAVRFGAPSELMCNNLAGPQNEFTVIDNTKSNSDVFSQKEQNYFKTKFSEFARGKTTMRELNSAMDRIRRLLLADGSESGSTKLREWARQFRDLTTETKTDSLINSPSNTDGPNGLAQMITSEVTYLTEKRIGEYETWRTGIMNKIVNMEAGRNKKRRLDLLGVL
ncbi:uncharacterized protein V1510DRAFT_160096 [Dipodascopsis tothii]|uniref:uncharacterized protein n=1 Tax=Dipodascopsis tothii TaxID=44089 RepID=UPI0034CF6414